MRELKGLRPLELDDTVSEIADGHCRDMMAGGFTSHVGRDSRVPYQRYCVAARACPVAEVVMEASVVFGNETEVSAAQFIGL